LVEETGVPVENYRPVASHWQTLSHSAVSSRVRTHNVSGDMYWWHSLLGEGVLSLLLECHPFFPMIVFGNTRLKHKHWSRRSKLIYYFVKRNNIIIFNNI
jgi:hypothetical protein